jgi:type I restriction enzyme M protein
MDAAEYKQANPTTWRLAAMNFIIRAVDFKLGREPASAFTHNQHPHLLADYILAGPPFNISDWWNEKLADDPRWQFGTPPPGNANFAWLQHILYHLKPNGMAGVVLANGSMASSQNNEGAIRRAMIEGDVIDAMVALPPQLFFNTQIPACLWFLTKNKRTHKGETLFIDARKLGRLIDRVNRVFDDDDIAKIANAYHAWREDGETNEVYADVPGFCRVVQRAEIQKHDYVLMPGRYVGAEEVEEDSEAFADKMQRLTAQLGEQFAASARLEAEIKKNLAKLGFTVTI